MLFSIKKKEIIGQIDHDQINLLEEFHLKMCLLVTKLICIACFNFFT